jgi:hypothetical protein
LAKVLFYFQKEVAKIFPLFFWEGDVVAAGLSTGELRFNRSEQKCRQLS